MLEQLVRRGRRAFRALWEIADVMVLPAPLALLEMSALPAPQVLKVRRVRRVMLEQQALPDRWAQRARRVQQARQVREETRCCWTC